VFLLSKSLNRLWLDNIGETLGGRQAMALQAAGIALVWIRDVNSKLVTPLAAGNINFRRELTVVDVIGSPDCGAAAPPTKIGSAVQQVDEFIDFTTGKLTDPVMQIIKGERIQSGAGITYVKNACISVPVPAAGDTQVVTDAQLAGLTAADTSGVTAIFQGAEGVEEEAELVGAAPAAANQVLIGDDQVTTHSANAGQILNLQFTTTGTIGKVMGGPLTPQAIGTVEVHGLVKRSGVGGSWHIWAKQALGGNTALDYSADNLSLTYTLQKPADWGSPSMMWDANTIT